MLFDVLISNDNLIIIIRKKLLSHQSTKLKMTKNASTLVAYLGYYYSTPETLKDLFKNQLCNSRKCLKGKTVGSTKDKTVGSLSEKCSKSHTSSEREQEHFYKTHGVNVKHEEQKDGSVLFNFKYIMTKVKWTSVAQQSRGTIVRAVSKDGNVKWTMASRPWDKFFNLNERHSIYKSAQIVPPQDSYLSIKYDGTCLQVWYDVVLKKWRCSTLGTIQVQAISRVDNTDLTVTYEELFYDLIKAKPEDLHQILSEEHTYLFELATAHNRLTTRYTKSKLVLLGVRHTQEGDYESLEMVHKVASVLGAEVPLMVPTANVVGSKKISKESIYVLMEKWLLKQNSDQVGETPEGVVMYDSTGVPLAKIKSVQYLESGMIATKGVSSSNVFIALLEGKADDYDDPKWSGFISKAKAWYKELWAKVGVLMQETKGLDLMDSKAAAKEYAKSVNRTKPEGGTHSILFRYRKDVMTGVLSEEVFMEALIELARKPKSKLIEVLSKFV